MSLEKVTCSYLGPRVDQIVMYASGQLQLLRDAETETTMRANWSTNPMPDPCLISQSQRCQEIGGARG
jgi:hypothetical protein